MTAQQLNEEILSPEEIFEKYQHLSEITIYKMFHHPDRFAQSIGMEKEDLFQLSRMGLYKGCSDFYKTEHDLSLKGFLIRNARWYVNYNIDRLTVGHRIYKSKKATEDNLASVISMSNKPQYDEDNTNTYYDYVAVDNINKFDSTENSPEKLALANIERNELLNVLSILKEDEREIIELRMGDNPMTFREIGEMKGVSKQCIDQKYKRIQEKCRKYLNRKAVAI